MRGPAQAIEQGAVVGRGELPLLDLPLELLLDLPPLRVERPRRRLGHVGLEARARGRLGDSEPHLSGAENADLANLHVQFPSCRNARRRYDTCGGGVNPTAAGLWR